MRRAFPMVLLATALSACGGLPKVDVKKEWYKTIANYSMVPLYPMREDVFVGDIRVHTPILGGSETSDSRFLARLVGVPDDFDVTKEMITKEQSAPDYSDPEFATTAAAVVAAAAAGTGTPAAAEKSDDEKTAAPRIPDTALPQLTGNIERWAQPRKPSILAKQTGKDITRLRRFALPRIEAARVTTGNLAASGVFGAIWKGTLGAAFEDQETLLISLTKLEAVELSDPTVIQRFRSWAIDALEDDEIVTAICHAALRWSDDTMKDVRVSLVTRAFYARGVRYSYGDTYGAALVASITQEGPSPEGSDLSDVAGSGEVGYRRRSGLGIEEDFNVPMAFGVNAATISPLRLDETLRYGNVRGYADRNKPLPERCKEKTAGFMPHADGESKSPN